MSTFDGGNFEQSASPVQRESTAEEPSEVRDRPSTEETFSSGRKALLAGGGALLAVAAIVTAGLLLGRGEGNGGDATPVDTSQASAEGDEAPEDDSALGTAAPPKADSPVDRNTVLGSLTPSDADFLIERPNGRTMLVPRLNGETPTKLADSFLTLYACYVTTGAQECLDELTSHPQKGDGVRDVLLESREYFELEELQTEYGMPDAQLEIFGEPRWKAEIISGTPGTPGSQYYVGLDPNSNLHAAQQAGSDGVSTAWQDHDPRTIPFYTFTNLLIEYVVNEQGKLQIVKYNQYIDAL